ncbi:glutathione S-transferase T3-like [Humulus lupulus]|uniref:glutathione S-transferase T3-like n=1 Tax=Humulus lupulus TaxID=3486 RepID=UPI002B40191C|nr:glutathione S-transferase T3-like [Humulus lupulus]
MVSRNYRPCMEKSSIDLNHETSSTFVSETQPEHGVEGLENVVLHNEDESMHKCKVKWSKEATILLISGWLNTSKDAIVGNDQTSTHFWARIAEYYNTNQKGEQERTGRQCKDHWNKMNQKVPISMSVINEYNKHSTVDEPKWNTMYQPKGGKRKKVSESGAFTSSSNADISDDEVREVRPTGPKAARRKGKEKKDTHAKFIEISERKASALEKLVAIKEKEAEDNRMTKYMDYLIMDTSHMTPEQKKDHENLWRTSRTSSSLMSALEEEVNASDSDTFVLLPPFGWYIVFHFGSSFSNLQQSTSRKIELLFSDLYN